MHTVSVIVPVYNAEKYLSKCLESIVNQTYSNIEIILINDGSKDNSLKIIKEYAVKDDRIKFFDQVNRGVSATRNVGLDNASGEYILFVDADDWIENNMIEYMLNLSLNNNVDIVFCGNDNANLSCEVKSNAIEEIEFWDREKQKYEFMLHKKITGMLWNKLIKKSLFDGNKFDEEVGYGEDAQMLWKVIKKCKSMLVTNQILYHHVMDQNSISHTVFSESKFSAIKVWEEIVEDCEKNHFNLLLLSRERLMSTAVYSYYEMQKSGHINADYKKYLYIIIKNGCRDFIKSKNISLKMKLYAIKVILL